MKISTILDKIDEKQLFVPAFQREYVWKRDDAKRLIDSAMLRADRIRACYQHAALKWVMSERMTNQSLRSRFRLSEGKAATTSQVIAATIDAGSIKPDEAVGSSRKYARYLPFWA